MAEDKQLLEVTVAAEELPDRLLVNGVEYRRTGEPPDDAARHLMEAVLYFESRFTSSDKCAWLLERWHEMRLHGI